MVFREVIGAVVAVFFPTNHKLALADTVADPVKAHVNGFGSFLFDSVIGNTGGGAVVGLDWGGGLGVS
jgi:hypothetical protein